MVVAAEEMLHRLREGELDIHQPAVGEHDDEEGEPAAGVAYCDRAEDSPIDLRQGVQGAGTRGRSRPLETGSCQPLGDGLSVNAECARNLSDGQALTIPAVADPGVRLVVDHTPLRG